MAVLLPSPLYVPEIQQWTEIPLDFTGFTFYFKKINSKLLKYVVCQRVTEAIRKVK